MEEDEWKKMNGGGVWRRCMDEVYGGGVGRRCMEEV